jgi:hypothetical protein
VRTYLLLRAPWWIRALVYGIYFGTVTGFLNATISHQDFATAAAQGALGGLIFGVVMGVRGSRSGNAFARIAGPVLREKLPAVLRATVKGPIPDDPDIRNASGRIIAYRLSRLGRAVAVTYVVFGLFAALAVYLVITSGPVWWLAFALFISFIPLTAYQASRTRRRAALFGVAADAPVVLADDHIDGGLQIDWGKVGRWIIRPRYLFVVAAVAMTGLAILRLIVVGGEHGWGEVILAVALWGVTLWVYVAERAAGD